MTEINVGVEREGERWVADVRVKQRTETRHHVCVSRDEFARYGGGDQPVGPAGTREQVADLVRRSSALLLEREPNTSILREFDLSTIERYFLEYPTEVANAGRS